MTEPKTISVQTTVTIDQDDFNVVLSVTRPAAPGLHRDMDTIKAEIERLLPGWIKPKIQAGEP